jgi:hypothetical protein
LKPAFLIQNLTEECGLGLIIETTVIKKKRNKMEIVYWPSNIGLPKEMAEEITHFLEIAYEKGFKPYIFERMNLGATNKKGRVVELLNRGRFNRWEPLLSENGIENQTTCRRYIPNWKHHIVLVEGFKNATEILLRWLEGEEGEKIFEDFVPSKRWDLLLERK